MIDVHGLRKSFRTRTRSRASAVVEAVKGIDIAADRGEVLGVLGPNGAGKSTTIRMLATLLRPDAGSGTVAGADLLAAPASVRSRIGYVGQAGGLDEASSIRANLLLAARVSGCTRHEAEGRAREVLGALDLTDLTSRPVRTLSGGQKRRAALAVGLVNDPPLVILDEPTVGLDPQNRANLWDHVTAARERGTTVLLSTHYLDEANSLCDRLVIIDQGTVVAEGTPTGLKRELADDVVRVRIAALDSHWDRIEKAVEDDDAIREHQRDGDVVRLYLDDGERALSRVLQLLNALGLDVQSVAMERATLDDVFLRRTGRSLRDAN